MSRLEKIALYTVMMVFAGLVFAMVFYRSPTFDEGMLGNPVYSLIHYGTTENTIYNINSMMYGGVLGLEKKTFYFPPGSFFINYIVTSLFEFDLFHMRWSAAFFSIALIWIQFMLSKKLNISTSASLFGILAFGFSNGFIYVSSSVRPDVIAQFFIMLSLFIFLKYKKESGLISFGLTHFIIFIAAFIHPYGGVIGAPILILLQIYQNGIFNIIKNLKWIIAAYFLGLFIYTLYIGKDWDIFANQFFGNAKARFESINFFKNFVDEIIIRQFGISSDNPNIVVFYKIIIGSIYVFLPMLFFVKFNKQSYEKFILSAFVISIAFLAIQSNKFHYYKIYNLPYACMMVGILLDGIYRSRNFIKHFVLFFILMIASQSGIVYQTFKDKNINDIYYSACNVIKNKQNNYIIAPPEFSYCLGFNNKNYKVDQFLGFHSNIKPHFFVIYNKDYGVVAKEADQVRFEAYKADLLSNSELIFNNSIYSIYKFKYIASNS